MIATYASTTTNATPYAAATYWPWVTRVPRAARGGRRRASSPAVRPDRPREGRQRAEDRSLVDRDVALQVELLVAAPEHEQALPGAETEAEVGRERNRDVDVEDPLRDPLIGVFRSDEEGQHDRETH